MKHFSQNTCWMLAEVLTQLKLQERLPGNSVEWKGEKCNRDGTCALGKELWRRKVSLTLGTSSVSWEVSCDREGTLEFQRRGECISHLAAGRTGRNQHAWSLPSCCTFQPKIHACWGGQQLGAEIQASADRPGEKTWFGYTETARRAESVVQAATRSVCRTEPGSAIRTPLSTCVKGEGHGPAIASLFSACSQRAWLYHYKLWERAGAHGLPTQEAVLKFELIPGAPTTSMGAQLQQTYAGSFLTVVQGDPQSDYWHSHSGARSGASSSRLCGCTYEEARLESEPNTGISTVEVGPRVVNFVVVHTWW